MWSSKTKKDQQSRNVSKSGSIQEQGQPKEDSEDTFYEAIVGNKVEYWEQISTARLEIRGPAHGRIRTDGPRVLDTVTINSKIKMPQDLL